MKINISVMAKNNHNLDNFFREKLSGYESPGKTGNWQLMNHLLEEKHRRRKMLKRFFLGMVLLVAVLSSYFIFIPGRDNSKNLASNEKLIYVIAFYNSTWQEKLREELKKTDSKGLDILMATQ